MGHRALHGEAQPLEPAGNRLQHRPFATEQVAYPADVECQVAIGRAIGEHGNARKTIDHPELGPIELDCDIVTVQGAELRLIIFTAEPGTISAEQLRLLAAIGTQRIGTPR